MLKSSAPAIITVPFASGASGSYRNTIPIPSQIPITPGLASWTDGFPPLTMTATGAGGIPPYGQDMNGLGFALSTINQWMQLGFVSAYSSSVSTAIGGYPQGACIGQLSGLGYWLSTADNNTTNPDTTGSTNWIAVRSNAGRSTISVTTGTVTPDPSVLGVPLLVLSGTLTGNVTLVLPLTQPGAGWAIYNATTGAFTVNVQGATGTGVTATQGSLTDVRTDGTNYYTGSLSGGPFLPLHATADAATKLATARTIAMTGDVTWVTATGFDGTANVTGVGAIAAGAVTLAKMANLAANTLLGNATGSATAPQAIALANGLQFAAGALGMGAITPSGITNGGALVNNGNATINGALTVVGAASSANTIFGYSGSTNSGYYLSVSSTQVSLNSLNSSGSFQAQIFTATPAGAVTFLNPVSFSSNASFTSGLNMGSTVGSSSTDMSHGIALFGNQYGFGITSTRLNYIVPTGGGHYLTVGGTDVASATSAGMNAIAFNVVSDENLKKDIIEIAPRPLHRDIKFVGYNWKASGLPGKGAIAQRVFEAEPLYTAESEFDGKPTLVIDKAAMAWEEASWAGQQVDLIWAELKQLRAEFAGRA